MAKLYAIKNKDGKYYSHTVDNPLHRTSTPQYNTKDYRVYTEPPIQSSLLPGTHVVELEVTEKKLETTNGNNNTSNSNNNTSNNNLTSNKENK